MLGNNYKDCLIFIVDRLKRSSMRSMATQTDVNNHRNQRHSSHYPLGSTDYADEKVQV